MGFQTSTIASACSPVLFRREVEVLYSSRPLEDGDIVNIDITVYLNGYHGDTSRTFTVGDVVCLVYIGHSS